MVDDLLFLAHEFLGFFEAIGFTLDVDNGPAGFPEVDIRPALE